MPKHIFINSHDLDTSMISAQLTGGKGRFSDLHGTCFGYIYDFKQLSRASMPESIRDKIDDNWLDAQTLIKYEYEGLMDSGITDEDAEILNAMPDGTYFWHTRHVSEMFQNIDLIDDAHIIQLVAHGWEPYAKIILQTLMFGRFEADQTPTIDIFLEEVYASFQSTNNCGIGLLQDGYNVTLCDYNTMFDAEAFATKVAANVGVTVDVKRNQKIIDDYLEENLGAVAHATDDEILAVDWDKKYPHVWERLVSPTINLEAKRMFVSDKKYFTEANNKNVREVKWLRYEPRDWVDQMVDRIHEDHIDEDYEQDYRQTFNIKE